MSCGLWIFFWCQQREGNFPPGSLKSCSSSLSDLTHSYFTPFFWSQLHGRCSTQLLLWDNSTFPRKVEKWSLLFPKDISSWELPGEANPSACPAEAKSICTTNTYSFPWSGSDISLLPPTKLTLAAGFPPAFTPVPVLQPQNKIFQLEYQRKHHCCSVTQQNSSQIYFYCDFLFSS